MPATSLPMPFPFNSGVTGQPLYSFFQELKLAAPIKHVMWAARLRPELVADCLAYFSASLGNWIQPEPVGNLPA